MIKTRYKAKLLSAAIRFLDVVLVTFIFANVWELANYGQFVSLDTLHRVQFTVWHLGAMLILAALWYLVFSLLGLYDFRRVESWGQRLWRVFAACSLGVAGIMFALNLLAVPGLRGPVPAGFWLATILIFLVYRSILWIGFYKARTSGRNIRYVVIVGLGERSIALWRRLEKAKLGYRLLGFVDDGVPDEFLENELGGPFLSPLSRFSEYLANHVVDEVLLALPMKSHYDQALQTIKTCAVQGIRIRLLTDLFDLPPGVDYHIERVDEYAFITYDTDVHSEFQHDFKRVFDTLVSGLALIVFSPLMLAISIAILIADGWPIFYLQERVGYNKRRFKMFKFRTMIRDAEKMQDELEALNRVAGPAFKIENDPRVTKLGRFLRKTSLDELPQFLNVFLGQMSLVGPRPLPVRDFERFYDDAHRRRFSVKPGLSGLWQVSGRSDMNFEEWMKLDTYYVDNWSFWLDLRILMRTVGVVFKMKGAY